MTICILDQHYFRNLSWPPPTLDVFAECPIRSTGPKNCILWQFLALILSVMAIFLYIQPFLDGHMFFFGNKIGDFDPLFTKKKQVRTLIKSALEYFYRVLRLIRRKMAVFITQAQNFAHFIPTDEFLAKKCQNYTDLGVKIRNFSIFRFLNCLCLQMRF